MIPVSAVHVSWLNFLCTPKHRGVMDTLFAAIMKVANFLCSVVMSLLSHVNAVASIPILASMAVSC